MLVRSDRASTLPSPRAIVPSPHRPPIGAIRTRIRFAWLPIFTDDRESFYDIAWLCPVRIVQRFSEEPREELFWREPPRWRTVRVERSWDEGGISEPPEASQGRLREGAEERR